MEISFLLDTSKDFTHPVEAKCFETVTGSKQDLSVIFLQVNKTHYMTDLEHFDLHQVSTSENVENCDTLQ